MTASGVSGRWVWLFPISQVLHVLEEYLLGYDFHVWLRGASDAEFSRPHTVAMHVAFVLAVTLATWLAVNFDRAQWIIVSLGILVLLNATSHVLGALMSQQALSGLFTSVGIWFPLGTGAVVKGWRHLSRTQFGVGLGTGILVQLPISWLAVAEG